MFLFNLIQGQLENIVHYVRLNHILQNKKKNARLFLFQIQHMEQILQVQEETAGEVAATSVEVARNLSFETTTTTWSTDADLDLDTVGTFDGYSALTVSVTATFATVDRTLTIPRPSGIGATLILMISNPGSIFDVIVNQYNGIIRYDGTGTNNVTNVPTGTQYVFMLTAYNTTTWVAANQGIRL